jgi:hypothetical protein
MLRSFRIRRSRNCVGKPALLLRRNPLRVEELEARCLLSVYYTPLQVRHAYGFDQISFLSGSSTVAGDGSGQTIAIVDAYDNPNIFKNLDTFDQQFSLTGGQSLYSQYGPASKVLTKATPQGQPAQNSGWGTEEALDVEWAHAVAPGAKVLLVEALTSSIGNLLGAVDYARKQPGVVAVSMSWGAGEFSGESSYDSYFVGQAGQGVTFLASSGDSGAGTSWPAVSSHVVAVGGTVLNLNGDNTWKSETGWSGSGGGISSYVSKPSYQSSVTQSSTKRTIPDVSYDASPSTGVYVYDSPYWYGVGGTSAGAPQWAGLVAIADQGRTLAGKGTLDSYSQTLPAIYKLPASDFHDITTGSNGKYSAGPGYDLVTGRGSPKAQVVVAGLVSSSGPAAASTAGSTNTTSTGSHSTSTHGVSSTTSGAVLSGTSSSPDQQALAAALNGANNRVNTLAVAQQAAAPTTVPLIPTLPGAPAVSTPPLKTPASTVQSGGGDSNDVQLDPDPMAAPTERQAPRRKTPPAPVSAPADPMQPDVGQGPVGAARWQHACTACFAVEGQTLVPLSAAQSAAQAQELLPPAQPLAAAIALGVVLGGYGVAPSAEREANKRRRALRV